MNIKISKLSVLLCVLFIQLSSFIFAQKSIRVKDCRNKLPLENVLIFTENGNYIGITDKEGVCAIKSDASRFLFSGLSINDTVVNVVDNRVCVSSKVMQLDEFNTKDKSIDAKTYFLELLNKSLDSMLDSDSAIYYKFRHTIEIPDSNWKETITGYFKVNNYSYKIDKEPNGFIYIKDYDISENFKNSEAYQHHLTKLKYFKAVTVDYIRNKRRRKLYKKYAENVVLQSDTTNLVFEMDFTRYLRKNGVSPKFKFYFDENEIIYKWENYSTNQENGNNKHLTTITHTKSYPKVVKHSKTYSVTYKEGIVYFKRFEIELLKSPPSVKTEFKKMFYYLNYQKMLKAWENLQEINK